MTKTLLNSHYLKSQELYNIESLTRYCDSLELEDADERRFFCEDICHIGDRYSTRARLNHKSKRIPVHEQEKRIQRYKKALENLKQRYDDLRE